MVIFSNRQVKAAFVGLNLGDKLAPDDSGIWVKDEMEILFQLITLSIKKMLDGNIDLSTWIMMDLELILLFIIMLKSKFTVPNNVYKLFVIVQGSPNTYIKSA